MLVFGVTDCCCDFAAVLKDRDLSAWYFRKTTIYPVNAYDNLMNIYDASAAKSWLSRH